MTRVVTPKAWAALLLATLVAATAVVIASETKPAHAAFAGTPNAIAFTTDRDGHLEVYRMGSDGFGPSMVSDQLQGNSNLPAFSPDGTKIAFTNDTSCFVGDSCPTLNTSIYVGRSDNTVFSSSTFRVTDNDSSFSETEAAWYPSGRRIAFTSNKTGAGDLYYQVVDEIGVPTQDPPVRLTKSAAFDGQAAVSPNGNKIAFVSERDGDREIYVMKATVSESATNKPIKLTDNKVPDKMPDWSPSGTQLVFQRGGAAPEIMRMNSDGRGQTNLTKNPSADLDPCFSPDGKKIAFDSNRDGDREIWRMRVDGSKPVNLTKNDGITDANPSWQPIP